MSIPVINTRTRTKLSVHKISILTVIKWQLRFIEYMCIHWRGWAFDAACPLWFIHKYSHTKCGDMQPGNKLWSSQVCSILSRHLTHVECIWDMHDHYSSNKGIGCNNIKNLMYLIFSCCCKFKFSSQVATEFASLKVIYYDVYIGNCGTNVSHIIAKVC